MNPKLMKVLIVPNNVSQLIGNPDTIWSKAS